MAAPSGAPTEVPRAAMDTTRQAVADTPVVAINGARQVGKSTLVEAFVAAHGGLLLTLDDESQRAAAEADPRGFLSRDIDGPLVVDEVQRAPALFRALKAEVDRDRRPGRFIVTGSTRLLSAPGFADALVGRLEIVELWPFSERELAGANGSVADRLFEHDGLRTSRPSSLGRAEYAEIIVRGGYPEAVRRAPSRRRSWFDGYVQTLTQKVIRDIAAIERAADLPRVLRLCAARTGTELNVANLAGELGIPPRTLDGYLALLTEVFVLQLLPAWSTNLSKKVVRRPKLVLADSGLAAHLTGITVERFKDPTAPIGALVETFAAMEIRKQITWSESRPTCWHFRDRDGAEVDLVLEHPDGRVVGIEIKASATVTPRDARGLRFLADRLGDRFHAGVVLSMMPEPTPLGPRLSALPLSTLWET